MVVFYFFFPLQKFWRSVGNCLDVSTPGTTGVWKHCGKIPECLPANSTRTRPGVHSNCLRASLFLETWWSFANVNPDGKVEALNSLALVKQMWVKLWDSRQPLRLLPQVHKYTSQSWTNTTATRSQVMFTTMNSQHPPSTQCSSSPPNPISQPCPYLDSQVLASHMNQIFSRFLLPLASST